MVETAFANFSLKAMTNLTEERNVKYKVCYNNYRYNNFEILHLHIKILNNFECKS